MCEQTIRDFVNDLSSDKPLGGGSACALVAALASALGQMVGSLTVNKKKYAQNKEQLAELMTETETLTAKLLKGIEDDQKAFYPLSQAYKLNKDVCDREQLLQEGYKQAALSPFSLLSNTAKVIDLLEKYAQLGSIIVLSDAATGAMLAHGALYGEFINIMVNTVKIKDLNFKNEIENQAELLLHTYSQKAMDIYIKVCERIKND
ncbi:MAG: cyclodeaminase/cyclohydrolase family protein [Erysipelotrichia bacterium]|nr:cyclodeaminase/cyclohydrolase family protein [Erysipelotrichia bacterium]